MSNDYVIVVLIFLGITIFQLVLISNINQNLKKSKQLLFVIMTLLGEKEKEMGKEINLKELYKKAEQL